MQKSELQQACEEHGVTIKSVHIALESDDSDQNIWRDKWSCTISFQGRSATFEFFSGIGHRITAPGWKQEGYNKWFSSGRVANGTSEAIAKGALLVKKSGPEVADVLSCLLSDASACETSFDEWCSDFGCDNDSLKHLNTYLACQRNGTKVRKILGYGLAQELAKKEH